MGQEERKSYKEAQEERIKARSELRKPSPLYHLQGNDFDLRSIEYISKIHDLTLFCIGTFSGDPTGMVFEYSCSKECEQDREALVTQWKVVKNG